MTHNTNPTTTTADAAEWAMAHPAHQVEVGAYWCDENGDWYTVSAIGSHWSDGATSGYHVRLAEADAPEDDTYEWVHVVVD